MRAAFLITLALLGPVSALAAEEPKGCDKFKWPVDRERAALTAPDRPRLASGADITATAPSGMLLALRPPGEAALPAPPERAPKEGTFAGFVRFTVPLKAGVYTISLSAAGWVDVVQDGHLLKPKAFSGATDCDGIRKTVEYELAASPFVVQFSGVRDELISAAILPSE